MINFPCEHHRIWKTFIEHSDYDCHAGHVDHQDTPVEYCLDCGKELEPGELPDLSPAELAEQLADQEG